MIDAKVLTIGFDAISKKIRWRDYCGIQTE